MLSGATVCWYLTGLYLVGLVSLSLMTVAPGHTLAPMMLFCVINSVVFAVLAIRWRRREASIGLRRFVLFCAVLSTLFVFFGIIG